MRKFPITIFAPFKKCSFDAFNVFKVVLASADCPERLDTTGDWERRNSFSRFHQLNNVVSTRKCILSQKNFFDFLQMLDFPNPLTFRRASLALNTCWPTAYTECFFFLSNSFFITAYELASFLNCFQNVFNQDLSNKPSVHDLRTVHIHLFGAGWVFFSSK